MEDLTILDIIVALGISIIDDLIEPTELPRIGMEEILARDRKLKLRKPAWCNMVKREGLEIHSWRLSFTGVWEGGINGLFKEGG